LASFNQYLQKKSLQNITRWVCVLLLASWFSSSALGMVSGSDNEQRVLMCTQNGYEWVAIAGADGSVQTLPEKPHCVFCFLHDSDLEVGSQHYSLAVFFDSRPIVSWRASSSLALSVSIGRWQ